MNSFKLKSSFLENNLKIVFEHLDCLIAVIDAKYDFKFEEIKLSSHSKLFEFSEKEFLGKSFLNLVHLDDVRSVIKILKKGERYRGDIPEIKVISKKGKSTWVEIKVKRFINESKMKKLLVSLRDISRRKALEVKLDNRNEKFKDLMENTAEIRLWKIFSSNKIDEALKNSSDILNTVIEHIPQMIFWKNNNAEYKGCNENYAHFLSLEHSEDIIGRKDDDLLWNVELREKLKGLENNVIKIKKPDIHSEEEWYDKDGTRTWLDVNRIPLCNSKGDVMGIIITYDNITEKKESEQKLKESEKKFKDLTELLPEIIFEADANLVITYVNPIGFEKTGYTQKEMEEGIKISKVLAPESLNKATIKIKRIFNGEVIEPEEFQIMRKNGSTFFARIHSRAIYKDGKIIGLRGIITDIDDMIKIKQELIVSKKNMQNERDNLINILDSMEDGVYIVNQEHDIQYVNPVLMKDFGSYKGIKCHAYFHDRQEICPWCKNSEVNLGNTVRWEWYSFKNQRIYDLMDTPIRNLDGTISKLEIFRDITERKKAEEKVIQEREKIKKYLDVINVLLVALDRDGKITLMNKKGYEILGYAEGELEGKNWFETCIPPQDRERVSANFNKLMNGEIKVVSSYENLIITKHEEERLISWSTSLLKDNKGMISGVISSGRDITEKKKYESLIEVINMNFLHYTADNQKNIDLLLKTGKNFFNADVVLYAFKSSEKGKDHFHVMSSENEILIYELEDFHEKLFISEIFVEKVDFPQSFWNINDTKYIETDPFLFKYKIKTMYGKLIKSETDLDSCLCALYSKNPVISAQERMVLFLMGDVIKIERERWTIKLQMDAQNKQLNEISRLKTELISRTSHELKTPLISIKGFTELILMNHSSKLDSDMVILLEEIKKGSKKLEEIILSLLETSRLEEGRLFLNKSNEDLSFLIKYCVNEINTLTNLRNQSIEVEIIENMPTSLDKERMHEVISNLLINAIKYTPPSGNIIIQSEIKNNFYTISVKDTGIGITEQEKPRLFQQFGKIERYGQGWDIDIEGSGLGLYISKGIIDLHGGEIWIESEGRNKGSTFFFTLPISKEIKS